MNQVEVKRKQFQAFSYMIGVITLIIVGRGLGDSGITYLAAAMEAFMFCLIILVQSLPEILGRMLRSRNAKGQYKGAQKLRKDTFLFQCGTGAVGGILLLVVSDILEQYVFKVQYSSFLIKLFVPVLLLRVISSVLEGYFQGMGTEMPTVAVCVLRQFFWLGFGLLFANILKGYGEKVSALLRSESVVSMYEAAGLVVGAILTECLLLLFLFLIFLGTRKKQKQKAAEGLRMTETFGSCVGSLYLGMSGLIIMNLLAKLPFWLGLAFFQQASADSQLSVSEFGVYYGKYLTLCALPVLFAGAVLLPVCARVAANVRREEYRFAKDVFGIGAHIGLVYTLFSAVFMTVMSKQLSEAFFVGNTELTEQMLKSGSVMVLFAVLSIYFLRILLLTGKRVLAFGSAGIYVVVSAAAIVILIQIMKLGAIGLVYAGLIGTGVLFLLSGFFVVLQLKGGIHPILHLLVPVAGSAVSGGVCMLLAKLVTPHLGNLVTIVLCLVLGNLIYWTILLLLRSFRTYELDLMPGGKALKRLAELFKVI